MLLLRMNTFIHHGQNIGLFILFIHIDVYITQFWLDHLNFCWSSWRLSAYSRIVICYCLVITMTSSSVKYVRLRWSSQLLAFTTSVGSTWILCDVIAPLLNDHLRLSINLLECLCFQCVWCVCILVLIVHQNHLFALTTSWRLWSLRHFKRSCTIMA